MTTITQIVLFCLLNTALCFSVNSCIQKSTRLLKDFRRLTAGILLPIAISVNAPLSFAAELRTFSNDFYHATLSYPADFVPLYGELSGERRVDAFVDPKDPDTSVSIVFTPIPADFSRLSSFGGTETLREYVLPRGDGVETNILDERVKGETYSLEYTINAPNSPKRHITSIFALKPREAIVAVNIQTKEETYENNKGKLEAIPLSLTFSDL